MTRASAISSRSCWSAQPRRRSDLFKPCKHCHERRCRAPVRQVLHRRECQGLDRPGTVDRKAFVREDGRQPDRDMRKRRFDPPPFVCARGQMSKISSNDPIAAERPSAAVFVSFDTKIAQKFKVKFQTRHVKTHQENFVYEKYGQFCFFV